MEALDEIARLCRTGQKDLQEQQYGIKICSLYPIRALELEKPPCFVRQGVTFENTRTKERYCICDRPLNYNPLEIEVIETPEPIRVNAFGEGPDKDKL